MGQLPSTRVQPAWLFTTTGIKCRTHCLTTGIHTQQVNTQGLHRHICLFFCDTGCPHWSCHKPYHWRISCCFKTFHHTSRKTEGHLFQHQNQCPRRPTSSRRSTTRFNVQPRWRGSRISWQQKAVTGSSSRYMDHTLEAYGKQQSTTWNTTCDKSRCTRLPPMKNLAPC